MKLAKYLFFIYLLAWLSFAIFPLLWTVMTSVKSPSDLATLPPSFIFKPSLKNYFTVLFGGKGGFYTIEQEGFWRCLLNSSSVALITTGLTLLLASMSSYYLTRKQDRSYKLLLWILSFRMMPPIAVVIPFFIMMSLVGLVDSIFSLILMYTVFNLPLAVWLISSYMYSIPINYDEMAMVDGFTRWAIFWRIILPISRPALITAGLLVFMFSWNEFLFALVLTGYQAKTLPVLATGFITERGIIWGQLTATAILITFPIFLLILLMQKYFVRGITLGLKE